MVTPGKLVIGRILRLLICKTDKIQPISWFKSWGSKLCWQAKSHWRPLSRAATSVLYWNMRLLMSLFGSGLICSFWKIWTFSNFHGFFRLFNGFQMFSGIVFNPEFQLIGFSCVTLYHIFARPASLKPMRKLRCGQTLCQWKGQQLCASDGQSETWYVRWSQNHGTFEKQGVF